MDIRLNMFRTRTTGIPSEPYSIGPAIRHWSSECRTQRKRGGRCFFDPTFGNSMKVFFGSLVTYGLLATCQLAFAESGIVLRQANLRAQPRYLAPAIQIVPPNTQIDIGRRRGSWRWVTLQGNGERGWVLDYKVRKNRPRRVVAPATVPERKRDDGGFFNFKRLSRGATGLFGFRRSQTAATGTSTVGIRGLSAVDLQNARPDPAQVNRLNRFTSSYADIELFAHQSGLRARHLAYADDYATQTSPEAEEEDTSWQDR